LGAFDEIGRLYGEAWAVKAAKAIEKKASIPFARILCLIDAFLYFIPFTASWPIRSSLAEG
jgi:hypothetical protein